MNIIEEVLSACVSSGKAKPIILIQKNGQKHILEGQIHAMLNAPTGTGKTSLIQSIENKDRLIHSAIDVSLPGLVGTITKDGRFVPGAAWYAAGRCLWMDEHQNMTQNARNAMLNLLSNQMYHRSMGFGSTQIIKKRGKYKSITVKDGQFTLKSQFSSLLTGLYFNRRNENDIAFLSRYIVISLKPTLDEIYDKMLGKTTYKIKPKKTYKGGHTFEDYTKFAMEHRKLLYPFLDKAKAKSSFIEKLVMRNANNLCKLAAWNSGSNSIVDDWEKYIEYIPLLLYNCITSTLSHTEYTILSYYIDGTPPIQIPEITRIPKSTVYDILKRLKQNGIIEISQACKNPKI